MARKNKTKVRYQVLVTVARVTEDPETGVVQDVEVLESLDQALWLGSFRTREAADNFARELFDDARSS